MHVPVLSCHLLYGIHSTLRISEVVNILQGSVAALYAFDI